MEDMDTRFNSEDDSGGEVPLPDDISVFSMVLLLLEAIGSSTLKMI
jgi:hypothetical protein